MTNFILQSCNQIPMKKMKYKSDIQLNPSLENFECFCHLNNYNFTLLVGRPRSGKSTFAINLLKNKNIYKKVFHDIIVIIPKTSLENFKDNPFKDFVENEELFYELNEENMNFIFDKIHDNAEIKLNKRSKVVDENYKKDTFPFSTLLFMDDVTASLKNKEIQKQLKGLIYNRRHLHLTIVITAQVFTNVPKDIRKMVNNLILFKPSSSEFEVIVKEYLENKKKIANELFDFVYDEPHNYLFLNIESGSIFKNQNKIVLS